MALPALQPFSLVGGTALSLRYGHRTSIDLDLFYHLKFDQPTIIEELEKYFNSRFVYKLQHTQFGIFCFIDNIKVDLVYFPHLPIADIEEEENIRFYSSADIAAMKIQAILGRAQKKRLLGLVRVAPALPAETTDRLAQTEIPQPNACHKYSPCHHLFCRC